jgi:hypothetical protein
MTATARKRKPIAQPVTASGPLAGERPASAGSGRASEPLAATGPRLAPLPDEIYDLAKVAMIRLFTAGDDAGGGEKMDPAKRVPVGKHQVRGVATIAVDAWVDRALNTESRIAWPSRDVLAFALQLAVGRFSKPSHNSAEILRELIVRAARACLRKKPGKDLALVQRTLQAMDGVQTELLNEIPIQPRSGATKVSGRATIVDWATEQTRHADGAGGSDK